MRGHPHVSSAELEKALEDTLMVVKMSMWKHSGIHVFRYREKTFHSLGEARKNIGAVVRYIVFAPNVGDKEQAAIRAAFFGVTKFYTMKDDWRQADMDNVLSYRGMHEKNIVFMEGIWSVPVSFFVYSKELIPENNFYMD